MVIKSAVPDAPWDWLGSRPEWSIMWGLTTLGMKDGVDFEYQSPQSGGRQEKGGAVLDFMFSDLNLAINVQSDWYHYLNIESRVHDQFVRAMVEGYGIRVVYIDEVDALRDPIYYIKEALAGRDHSRMEGR